MVQPANVRLVTYDRIGVANGVAALNGSGAVIDAAGNSPLLLSDRKTRLVVGATNADHATLAAALAAAASGDEVFLRAGTHALTSMAVPAGVTVRGSKAGVTLEGSFNTTTTAVTLGAGAVLERLHIRNTHATGTGGVTVAVSTASAADVAVRDCKFTGTWSQGVLSYQGSNVTIRDCIFDTLGQVGGSLTGDAINVFGTDGASIQGCHFKDLPQDAVYVGSSAKNVTIANNVIRGCPEGIQVRVSCESVTIVGNTFDIKGSSAVNSFGVIVQTDSVDCVISGNTFRTTAGTGTPIAAVSVDNRSHRTIVTGNTIKGLYSKGVSVQTTGGASNESLGCVVSDNTFTALASYSIWLGVNEDGATVSGNRVNGGGDKAILIQADRNAVTGNVVIGNSGFDGITIQGSFNSITGNVVTNVGANAGILISGSDNAVTGNTCTANNTHGINETGNRNLILGNNVTGNSHATADIAITGAATKVAYNIGRYTQVGAA